MVWAALGVLAGRFTVPIPGVKSRISISDAFILANIMLFGTYVGVVTAALDGSLGSVRAKMSGRRYQYALFNTAALSISSAAAGIVFPAVLGMGGLFGGPAISLRDLILPALLAAITHQAINTLIVAAIISLESRKKTHAVWRERFLWTLLTAGTSSAAAALIVANARSITPGILGLVLPILFIIYFTYRTYLEKEEQNAHRQQLDLLYIRTVETLAVAIDARESGNLGQAQQVQIYATGLARAMNIHDDKVLRGIEAAALLLDVGNLAVPEYILNNPGQLTPKDYEKVKTHPIVGSKILARIDFPYPVVEFVRHHHERWDGGGYPDALRGEQIPLGSRILAVADCFVVLTNNRPYQMARSPMDALRIIRARKGTHYDPVVVEKFAQTMPALVKEARQSISQRLAGPLSRESEAGRLVPHDNLEALGDISAAQREAFALLEISQALGGALSLQETLSVIGVKLALAVPFTTCVVYLTADDAHLRASFATGADADAFTGHTLEVAGSPSGWCATSREPVVNALAARDLSGLGVRLSAVPETLLACPLITSERCLGTISLYLSAGQSFSTDDCRILGTVALKAAAAIEGALRYEEAREDSLTDPLTLLPNLRGLQQAVEGEMAAAKQQNKQLSILVMDLDRFKGVNDVYGHQVGDRMLIAAARLLSGVVREGDIIARQGGDEFVAALPETGRQEAQKSAERIEAAMGDLALEVLPGNFARVGISIGCATYPEDGDTLEQLLRRADAAMYEIKSRRAKVALARQPAS